MLDGLITRSLIRKIVGNFMFQSILIKRPFNRLGHKEQKDEFLPRLVETFQRGNVLPSTAVIAAGSAYSAATAGIYFRLIFN